jgi:hypothetical protein
MVLTSFRLANATIDGLRHDNQVFRAGDQPFLPGEGAHRKNHAIAGSHIGDALPNLEDASRAFVADNGRQIGPQRV